MKHLKALFSRLPPRLKALLRRRSVIALLLLLLYLLPGFVVAGQVRAAIRDKSVCYVSASADAEALAAELAERGYDCRVCVYDSVGADGERELSIPALFNKLPRTAAPDDIILARARLRGVIYGLGRRRIWLSTDEVIFSRVVSHSYTDADGNRHSCKHILDRREMLSGSWKTPVRLDYRLTWRGWKLVAAREYEWPLYTLEFSYALREIFCFDP